MIARTDKLILNLEEDEILHLWNIVMFAMDFHNREAKQGSICMNEAELKLANEIIEITDKLR